MGIKRVHVAELLVTSVKMDTRKQSTKIINQPGKTSKTVKRSPIHSERPETCNCLKEK